MDLHKYFLGNSAESFCSVLCNTMNRDIRKQIVQIVWLLGLILLVNISATHISTFFEQYLFSPLQVFRCWLFRLVPFSIGDLLYLAAIISLLYFLIKAIRKNASFKRINYLIGFLKVGKFILLINLILLVLWGINYEQPKLAKRLALSTDTVSDADLIAFDSLLITRLNSLRYSYCALSLAEINQIAAASYKTGQKKMKVFAKPTLMGNGLAYFGIEGYFNPFSGEAQVNKKNPDFMQPFVVAHEMAHQTGIAAEDDANLMAYIRSMESENKTLQYSACFNIWLYTHRRVFVIDSNLARELKVGLNDFSLSQLDTLRQRRIQYQTFLDDISSFIFDAYLKMGNQKEGIGSYRNVAYSALCWERKKRMIP
ncbi:MAG: DUF3810 family protein [Chitinophagaceae bacterium]|jgi:hypothetical protein